MTVVPPLMSTKSRAIFSETGIVAVGTKQSREMQDHEKGGMGMELEDLLGGSHEGRKRESRDPYLILQILIGIENKLTTTMKGMVGELRGTVYMVFWEVG